MGRWLGTCVLGAVLATLAVGVGGVGAQAPSAPPTSDLCVVTLDELDGLTGLAFERMASGVANCAYEGGPDEAPFLLDLHLADPGNGFIVFDTPADRMAGYEYTLDDAHQVDVAGRLGWLGTDTLAVDMGGQVLVLQPVLVFVTDPPDPLTFLPPVAELAVGRLPEMPVAAPEDAP